MAVHPQVGGHWLSDICGFGEVTWSTAWLGGLDTFSWAIPTIGDFPALRRGTPVALYDGGLRFGVGTITEVTPGQVHGEGLWRMAAGAPALDASGNPTTVPNTAIDQAVARGDLPGWGRAFLNAPTALASTEPGTALSVAEVLERAADMTSKVPWIDFHGWIDFRSLPAGPSWQATPPDGKLTTASDEYASHLVASFYVSAGVVDSRTYGDAAAAAQWGQKTLPVDLRPLGVITTGTVDSILAGMLAKGMARPTWAGTLEVAYGEITTLGGAPVPLGVLAGGDGIRLHGTFADSRLLGGYSYTDITAGRVEYVDGAATARITPVGHTPRDLKSILTVALEGAA